jgi:hypothetical protein
MCTFYAPWGVELQIAEFLLLIYAPWGSNKICSTNRNYTALVPPPVSIYSLLVSPSSSTYIFFLYLPISIIMAKRKGSPSSARQPKQYAKRARYDQLVMDLTDTKSILDQAEPYRLATARLPLDALTPVWTVGSNRPVNVKHAQSLCRIFKEQHLQREPRENHMRIACSQTAVRRMIDHLALPESSTLSSTCLPFDDWMAVNGTKAEIMAGQHRVEALKLFLQQLSSRSGGRSLEKEQSWWICDLYDIGRSYPGCSCKAELTTCRPTSTAA